MSRALLVMAYAKARGQQPTDAECAEFLAALAELAGGEYLYVPKLPQSQIDASEVWRLHRSGKSIREIADHLGCSTKPVWTILQQPELLPDSPYEGDRRAA